MQLREHPRSAWSRRVVAATAPRVRGRPALELRVGPSEHAGCAPAHDGRSPPGAWSGEIAGLPAGARCRVRPVKGQILRLRDPAGPGLLERVVRFEGGYLVPRGDGRYVLGATVEERGFELLPTAGGVL